jgi:hypothetical protein
LVDYTIDMRESEFSEGTRVAKRIYAAPA